MQLDLKERGYILHALAQAWKHLHLAQLYKKKTKNQFTLAACPSPLVSFFFGGGAPDSLSPAGVLAQSYAMNLFIKIHVF